MKENLKILILDDEKYIRDELKESLTDNDFSVLLADRPSTAFDLLRINNIDIVVLDINLPEKDGIEVLKEIKENYSETEVIMITAQTNIDYAIKAIRYGAADFFLKPFSIADVLVAIKKTERFRQLNRHLSNVVLANKILSENIREDTKIIGNSQKIIEVLSLMSKIAKFPGSNILIRGESGTGKELVAHGIHNLSKNKNEICYAVNCAAIPGNLFESELFGHVKGAFTGAISNKIGCFELTQNGTLILDEITEIPMSLQAKLLRVLEERSFSKVGSHKMIKINSTVIATTNKDIKKMVRENKFREDLYHRLNSFYIEIPPLRERKEDIKLLINYFSKEITKKLKKKSKKIDKSVYDLLEHYYFPGNIRELKNILERVIIINNDEIIGKGDFDFLNINSNQSNGLENYDLSFNERKLIIKVLQKCSGNKLQAAKLLNISWQSLDRRLKKHNISIKHLTKIQ